MHYDIEADWRLLDTCNYACAYCFSSEHLLRRPLKTFATAEVWRDAFNATGRTWLLHMTGGEPTIYPDFAALCSLLTEQHFSSMNINLSRPSVYAFAEAVNPDRVSFINAGLHYAERLQRQGLDRFIEHLRHLLDRDFPVYASVVATPEVLAGIEEIIEALRPAGVLPVPKLLRAQRNGLVYPEAYTPHERRLFTYYSELARESYASLPISSTPPTINPFADADFVTGVPSYVGRMCEAGQRFVSIRPDGSVFRCSKETRLGNLLKGTFKPLVQSAPCDTSYCYYFCEKYALPTATPEAARVPVLAGAA